MSPSSPVLPKSSVEDRIGDERILDEPASDANTMVEKNEYEAENAPVHGFEAEEELSPDNYPKGLQFFFILLALIFSIFMVALDLVCFELSLRHKYVNTECRPSLLRLSQRSRINFIAFPRSDGTDRPFF